MKASRRPGLSFRQFLRDTKHRSPGLAAAVDRLSADPTAPRVWALATLVRHLEATGAAAGEVDAVLAAADRWRGWA
jgi:hypothetical protein